MASRVIGEEGHKDEVHHVRSLPEWVGTWSAFVNKLHKKALIVSCANEECDADIQLTRDNVHQDGVTIHCESCGDFARFWPQEWVRGLRSQGVDLDE